MTDQNSHKDSFTTFTVSAIPFLQIEVLQLNPTLTGVFAIYTCTIINGETEMNFLYWGEGNIKLELTKLLNDPRISHHGIPLFGYHLNVADPEKRLERLKKQFPPMIP